MKSLILKISIVALVITPFIQDLSAQSNNTNSQNEYRIKIVKVDGNKKTELDTIVTGKNSFVWNGDTINPVNGMIFMSIRDGESEDYNFSFSDGIGQEFFIVTDKEKLDSILEVVKKNISTYNNVPEDSIFNWHRKNNIIKPFDYKQLNSVNAITHLLSDNKNIIDLSDEKIISYRRKEIRDGKEKITIIRMKKSNEEGRKD